MIVLDDFMAVLLCDEWIVWSAPVAIVVAPIGKKGFFDAGPRQQAQGRKSALRGIASLQVARRATLAEGNAFRYDLNYDVLRSV
jgi:hypothetical protein